jgi:hypothetical protein
MLMLMLIAISLPRAVMKPIPDFLEVKFFERPPSRAWVSVKSVRGLTRGDVANVDLEANNALARGLKEASHFLGMTSEERRKKFEE